MCFKSEGGNMHDPLSVSRARNEGAKPIASDAPSSLSINSAHIARTTSSQVLLATAIIIVEDNQGSRYPARALLDSGSECNFMSEGLCKLMKCSSRRVNISIQGIGQTMTRVSRKISATIRSRISSYSRATEFLVLKNVTACLPTTTVVNNKWNIPEEIQLADPDFFRSRRIDIVLGIPAFFSFFQSGREISLGDELPMLTESAFGWIVSGEIKSFMQHCNSGQPGRINDSVLVMRGSRSRQ
jgi:hypothetical protein